MEDYRFLDPASAREIRIKRIQRLEEDHFHALLLVEEEGSDGAAMRAARELERRIDHHVQVLTRMAADQDDVPPTPVEPSPNDAVPVEAVGTSQ